MTITVQRTNNVVLTKGDLTEALRQYLERNNVEGSSQTAGNYQITVPAEGLNGATDDEPVITIALPLNT